jgi:hypothetical protein
MSFDACDELMPSSSCHRESRFKMKDYSSYSTYTLNALLRILNFPCPCPYVYSVCNTCLEFFGTLGLIRLALLIPIPEIPA